MISAIAAALLAQSAPAAPFQMRDSVLGSSQLYVQCTIGGTPTSCLLDTGADTNKIQADAKSAEFPFVGEAKFSGAAGTIKECDAVSVPEVEVDSRVLTNQLFTRCIDSLEMPTTLGISYFENSSFELDFQKSQITSPAPKPSDIAVSSMRNLEKGHRIISVQLGTLTLDALFDTGAGLTSIDEEFVKSHPDFFSFVREFPADDVTGASIPTKLYRMKSLVIGGRPVSDDYVLSMPMAPDLKKYLGDVPLILGINHIRKLNWYFNLAENIWGIGKT